jgi:hypothetical protein
MESIKLLLAHSDRRISNQIEVAVLDVCYDRAAVQSSRTCRLDELAHQGGLWDYDLIVVGAENLFRDRTQQCWASADEVADAIANIRLHSSSPIVAYAASEENCEALLQAGADIVLNNPLDSEQLKRELRSLLDWTEVVETSNRWSGFGSLLKGFQKVKAAS